MKYTNKQYELTAITDEVDVLKSYLERTPGAQSCHLTALLMKAGYEDLQHILTSHYVNHGVGLGVVNNETGKAIGIGGVVFLEETATYELVYLPLEQYTDSTKDVLNYLLSYAFNQLGIDKVCANTVAGTTVSEWLTEHDFAYCGERTFVLDGTERIWHYYELENEAIVAGSFASGIVDDTGWDSIF